MKKFRLALGFLSIIPLKTPIYGPGDLGRSAGWFPWVGCIIGGIVLTGYWVLAQIFPSYLAAALAASLWIAITGGLHLDGLADCCDGLLSSKSPMKRLEIMRDPHVGSFGVIGLVLAVGLKIIILVALPQPLITQPGLNEYWGYLEKSPGIGIILAATCGRWVMLLAARLPSARVNGLGADFSLGLQPGSIYFGVVIVFILILLTGWRGLAACLAGHLGLAAIVKFAMSRLGGMTGDVLGLVVELTEIIVLLVFTIQI